MSTRRATLLEVIYPRFFPDNSKRAEAMRTITQPDTDLFEQAGAGNWRSEASSAQAASSQAHRGSA